MIGPDIGPYRVVRELGSGGMGTVLLAEDTRLRRLVALKTIRPGANDPAHAHDLLLREARAAAAINHPHVAAVHDVLSVGDVVAIVSEYCEGETLGVRMRRGPFDTADAVRIGAELADGLAAAHDKGVVHRDLKPANVMIGPGGATKILDFGIARLLIGDRSTTGAPATTIAHGFLGTPDYAAPEQWSEQPADARTDLYALGAVLFEMASGNRPFGDAVDGRRLGARKLQEPAPRLRTVAKGVPQELDELVASLLATEPEARPPDARAVGRTLRRLHDGLTHVPPPPVPPPVRHHPWAWVFAAALSLAVLGGAAWLRMLPAASAPPRAPVVAVLPLSNGTGDASKDYLVAGVADSLVIGLASLKNVTVLSREVVADARSRKSKVGDLARDLDASYLVEGRLQQVGDKVRLSLTVLQPDGAVVWGESVEGPADSLFDLQARLAGALTRALQVEVTPGERQELRDAPTSNPEALQAYWQGRALLDRNRQANLDAAVAAFSQAVSLDPRFALAHAALGEAYWAKWNETKEPSWVDRALSAGTTALRLDPEQPEVRYALALSLAGSGKTDEAIEELQRALVIRPHYDEARRQLGNILAEAGRIDEAVVEYEKAIVLRPNAWQAYSDMGVALYRAARYEQAVAALVKVTELAPDDVGGFQRLGTVYHQMGHAEQALANYQRAIEIRPLAQIFTNMGALLHEQGRFREAIEAYHKSLSLRPNSHITQRNLGDSYARLAMRREAQQAYARAIALVEQEVKINTNDARNLAYRAVYLQKAGRTPEAEQQIVGALKLAPNDVQVLYRAAVVYALAGLPEQALEKLGLAIDRGFSADAAQRDEDLDGLRKHARFAAVIGGSDRRGRK